LPKQAITALVERARRVHQFHLSFKLPRQIHLPHHCAHRIHIASFKRAGDHSDFGGRYGCLAAGKSKKAIIPFDDLRGVGVYEP
jgi:hypothetical protein